MLFCYDGETSTGNDSQRKHHFLQHKEKQNNKVTYTDGSKYIGRKVCISVVFADITRTGAIPEEASIHTAEMIAMRKIQKREDKRWVI